MTAWYGVSQDRSRNVFGSFDPSKFMVYFVDEDDPEGRSPEDLNALAVKLRDAFRDDRAIAAVVQGSRAWCQRVRDELDEGLFEIVVFVGPINMLKGLRVRVLDEHWGPGQPQVSMDEVFRSRASLRRGSRVATIFDGTRGVLSWRRGTFARVILEGQSREIVVPIWAVKED